MKPLRIIQRDDQQREASVGPSPQAASRQAPSSAPTGPPPSLTPVPPADGRQPGRGSHPSSAEPDGRHARYSPPPNTSGGAAAAGGGGAATSKAPVRTKLDSSATTTSVTKVNTPPPSRRAPDSALDEAPVETCLEYLTRPHSSWDSANRMQESRQRRIAEHDSSVLARTFAFSRRSSMLSMLSANGSCFSGGGDAMNASFASVNSVASAPAGFPRSGRNGSRSQTGTLRKSGRLISPGAAGPLLAMVGTGGGGGRRLGSSTDFTGSVCGSTTAGAAAAATAAPPSRSSVGTSYSRVSGSGSGSGAGAASRLGRPPQAKDRGGGGRAGAPPRLRSLPNIPGRSSSQPAMGGLDLTVGGSSFAGGGGGAGGAGAAPFASRGGKGSGQPRR